MSRREDVCVLLGGSSDERAISIRSGIAITEALIRKGVRAFSLDARNGFQKKLKAEKPSMAFIAVHGKGGEDGRLQRELEKLSIPYVGSGPVASSQTFDKQKSKQIFKKHQIPTPTWALLTRKNWRTRFNQLPIPAVIKPIANGSSIGVMMVERRSQLMPKIKKSLKIYSSILVEKKIEGREFTVGILGGCALPVIELKPKRSFYDYKAKYTKGMTEYLVPAPIHSNLSKKLSRLAKKAHQVLGLRDFSRVDLMVDQKNQPFVLEVNSIPGFTETSLLPKAAKAVGIGFDELCVKLLQLARNRVKK